MNKQIIDKQLNRTKNELEKGIKNIVGGESFEAWKKFAFKGHIMQMAIAFILGAAFQKVVSATSKYMIMPVLNYVVSFAGTNWRDHTFEIVEGLKLETGKFAGDCLDFFLISILLFIIYRKVSAIFKEEEKPKEEEEIICIETIPCPVCQIDINYLSKRCPNCTSWLIDKPEDQCTINKKE